MEAVVGLFEDKARAEAAIAALLEAGFTREEISLLLRHNDQGATLTPTDERPEAENKQTAIGAAVGAGGGAALGGFAGLLLSAGLVTLPGIGPIIAAGTLASALGVVAASAGVGAAAGGLAGGLIGFGLPEEEAYRYAEGIAGGNVLVVVHAGPERATAAADLLRQFEALAVSTHGLDWQPEQ